MATVRPYWSPLAGSRTTRPINSKIGYVINFMSHEWYQNISKSATARAAELDVELIVADANLDVAAQISKAENLLAQGVQVLILSPVDAKAMGPIVRQAKAAGVHVITEANPVSGGHQLRGDRQLRQWGQGRRVVCQLRG